MGWNKYTHFSFGRIYEPYDVGIPLLYIQWCFIVANGIIMVIIIAIVSI